MSHSIMTHLVDDVECVNVLHFRYLSLELAIMAAYKVLLYFLCVGLWTVCLLNYVTT